MTRDQALKILGRIWGGNPQHDLANSYADAFVALGMLKLDEPKNQDDRLAAVVMSTFSFDTNTKEMALFRKELEAAGLKIVEKQS